MTERALRIHPFTPYVYSLTRGHGEQIMDAGDRLAELRPGTMQCWHLNTRTYSLSQIRSATSSQCRTCRWYNGWVHGRTYTTRAAALRTRCSLSVVFFGAPLDPPDSSRHDKHMHATCVTTQSSSCDRRVRRNCLTCRWVPSRVLSNDKLEYVGLQAHEQLQVWWHELLWVSRKDVGTLETHSYSYKHKRNVPVRKFLTFTDTELNK